MRVWAVMLVLAPLCAQAQVYKCVGADGKVDHADKVCAGPGKTLTIYNTPSKAEVEEKQRAARANARATAKDSKERDRYMRDYERAQATELRELQIRELRRGQQPPPVYAAPMTPYVNPMDSSAAIERERARAAAAAASSRSKSTLTDAEAAAMTAAAEAARPRVCHQSGYAIICN